ncbi:MAG: ribonuclease HII [Rhodobacteraceae bacterium]|jgi:ribonuclease HII|nr:ribonuclease HII [Paracoccaceae bacterium]MBL4557468.1 ribonuclease HII [Paracoccaceae bacterium]HBG98628.1 ribonuclease HII [Paracoccaceae bacterium]
MAEIAGVDEAGRGPLAGPVLAAAVILPDGWAPPGLDDSKKLSAAERRRLDAALRGRAIWALGAASVAEIDRINIREATHLAMRRAVAALGVVPDRVLIDGNALPGALPCPAEAIVGGDASVPQIAAASILAKVARDRIMARLDTRWPGFGWAANAGYGTRAHRDALARLGVTPHHRRSFRPIYHILCQESLVTH